MRTLAIQFQSNRSPDLTVEAVTKRMAQIAASLSDLREFSV
jgi:hypothetical protein